MRNNKAILDEASRSVRRTFIGSIAGTVGMLAVVGAAGAYGMPERLTAQALTAAMSKFNIKFPHEQSASFAPRPTVVAQNAIARTPLAVSPMSDVAPDEPIVPTAPQVVAPAPVAAPRETPIAIAPQVMPVEAAAAMASAAAPVVTLPAPEPVVTASLPTPAMSDSVVERPFLSSPMVFEAPKPDDVQTLTEMPKTEEVVPAPSAVPADAAKPAVKPAAAPAPVQQASLNAEPAAVEFPKSVMIHLPLSKPPLTPAQRLDLSGKDYDKAEKCLAQAVYFEARNEPARGQQAVAQVVLNRVFSPYYPKDVCSVVYQNAHRHLSCQFTFACDGKPESINEQGAWARANRVAKQTLDAKVWLPEVAKATHYHAAYVRPNWIRDMKVMVRYGLHTFYRPRNWGDGSNEPAWGSGAAKKARPS